jgi:hypothetical protein
VLFYGAVALHHWTGYGLPMGDANDVAEVRRQSQFSLSISLLPYTSRPSLPIPLGHLCAGIARDGLESYKVKDLNSTMCGVERLWVGVDGYKRRFTTGGQNQSSIISHACLSEIFVKIMI